MGGFYLLYLPLILLMRSGDVETNPGPNPTGPVEWEWELLQLAERIDPADYLKIGLSLGVRHVQLQKIMKQQLNDNTNALMAVFMIWNNKPLPGVNKRDVLADKLQQNGLVDLSNQIRNGNSDANLTEEPARSLEPQNEPLSPTLIERCRNDFKSKYRSSLCKIRSDPFDPNSVVKYMYMYTDLVLKEEYYKGGRPEKELLTYTEFVNITVNGKRPRRLMVQGEAGAGKTTFCAQIAWDWINGKYFEEFVWVLVVPLRVCEQYTTLGEIAKSYLTKSNPTTAHQLTEYIRSNPDKVFIVCDGLDEFIGNVEQAATKKLPVYQMRQSVQSTSGSLLPGVGNPGACENPLQTDTDLFTEIEMDDILCSEELETCPVLVTSRPWRAKEIRSNGDLAKLYTFIHVEGFSKDGLSDYIHKFFPEDDGRANRLIKLTEDSDVISKSMAHFPIYVAIICLMWREISDQKVEEMESFQTFCQVFRQMFHLLKEHFAQKKIKNVVSQPFRDYLKEINNLLEPVSNLALTGLLENKLVFDESDFQHFPKSLEIAYRVGILSQENKICSMLDCDEGSSSHLQTRVFFTHKLFQEFMAGMHLASICKSDCNEFKRLMEKVVLPRGYAFRYLLYFAASQDKEVGINVMKCMVQGLNERTDLLVDVAFECNHPEAVAVVHDKIPPKKQEMKIDYSMTSHTIAAYLSIGIDAVNIHISRDFNLNDSRAVARIVCSSTSLQSLNIWGSSHEDFFRILKEKSADMQINTMSLGVIYSFENGHMMPVSRTLSHDMAETICSLPHLHTLRLNCTDVHDEFYSVLKEKAPSLKIQIFTILWRTFRNNTTMSDTSEDDLVEALSLMPELAQLTLKLNMLHTIFDNMNQRASSCESCFPQVGGGNFIFNDARQTDMQSFLHTLEDYAGEKKNWSSSDEERLSFLADEDRLSFLTDDSRSLSIDEDWRSLSIDEDRRSLSVDEDRFSFFTDEDSHSISIDEDKRSLSIDEDRHSLSVDEDMRSISIDEDTCRFSFGSDEHPFLNNGAQSPSAEVARRPTTIRGGLKRRAELPATLGAGLDKLPKVIRSSYQEASSSVRLCDYSSSDESTSP